MLHHDSIDKIVRTYFAAITMQTFHYKGVAYTPRSHVVSPNIVNPSICKPNCGACCRVFSLDYLPTEAHPYALTPRDVDFNGRRVRVFSDMQANAKGYYCPHLTDTAQCSIHGAHPFTCDFELIRFAVSSPKNQLPHRLTTRLYGRYFSMRRIDGALGAICAVPDTPTTASIVDTRRKLQRLQQWAKHFGVKTSLPMIIDYIDSREWASGRALTIEQEV